MAGQRMWRRALISVVAVAGMAALPPAASASIGTPTLALAPTSATAASTANLGTDITFSPSGGDSVKNLLLALPPGLIANATVDNGACLTSSSLVAACVVGTGTVTAAENTLLGASLSLPAEFTLVAPPAAGDLAGLQASVKNPTTGQFTPLGPPAAVEVRPSGDPAGVGLNIAFTNIPDTFPVLGISTSISVTQIDGTFDGLRFPASCPPTPATVAVFAGSYSDPTLRTATAPLTVTGCGSLPFSPSLSVTAVRDSADRQVQITTDIRQGSGQATPSSVALTLPTTVLSPNITVIARLCAQPASGTCTPVGSTTAISPLYPEPLSGKAYLTGTPAMPGLALVFPSPFPITLDGAVNLATNSTTFTGVPDIPLSDLQVQLDGGPEAVFSSSCMMPSGIASTTLLSQDGDRTATATAAFTVSDCTAPAGGGTGTGGNSGSGSGKPTTRAGKPKLSGARITGLVRGHLGVDFKVTAGKGAPKLRALTVRLPTGLSFRRHRAHGKLTITAVKLTPGKLRSLRLSGGRLRITLRRAVSSLTVSIGPAALQESGRLRSGARQRRVKSLELTVVAQNAKRARTTLRAKVTRLGLAA